MKRTFLLLRSLPLSLVYPSRSQGENKSASGLTSQMAKSDIAEVVMALPFLGLA
jgi:hypothetical protein